MSKLISFTNIPIHIHSACCYNLLSCEIKPPHVSNVTMIYYNRRDRTDIHSHKYRLINGKFLYLMDGIPYIGKQKFSINRQM